METNERANPVNGIRTLIVDDEAAARRGLRILLEEDLDIEIVGEASNGTEAVKQINAEEPELVFLDIQMPGMNGFEVLAATRVDPLPAVIFVTAYDQYAVSAFEVHAVDYLLKPVSPGRFSEALVLAKRQIRNDEVRALSSRLVALLGNHARSNSDGEGELAPHPPGGRFPKRVIVKTRHGISLEDTDNIEWIEASGDRLILHAGNRTHVIRGTMKQMEASLDSNTFLRVHRSAIVNLKYVREFQPYFHGEFVVIMRDETHLRLSRRRRELLETLLGQRLWVTGTRS